MNYEVPGAAGQAHCDPNIDWIREHWEYAPYSGNPGDITLPDPNWPFKGGNVNGNGNQMNTNRLAKLIEKGAVFDPTATECPANLVGDPTHGEWAKFPQNVGKQQPRCWKDAGWIIKSGNIDTKPKKARHRLSDFLRCRHGLLDQDTCKGWGF